MLPNVFSDFHAFIQHLFCISGAKIDFALASEQQSFVIYPKDHGMSI